jgi:hypothetical protein
MDFDLDGETLLSFQMIGLDTWLVPLIGTSDWAARKRGKDLTW